jgi:hypothetical protein
VGTHVSNRLSSTVLARAHELNLRTWVPTFLKKLMNLTNVRTSVPTFLTKPTNIYQFLVVIVSILSRQAARMVKEDEKISKKTKSTLDPKAAVSKKRKAEDPEPKITEATEETPSTPEAADIAEILKVMTESLPIKLLSPLGRELAKLL